MANPPIAFVAYSSHEPAIEQLIGNAVHVANGKDNRLRYESWVYNDIPGNPLISPIIDRIHDSAFIIADITTLNLNVVYEIGFAIGRQKRAYLIRHQGSAGDKAVAREAGAAPRGPLESQPRRCRAPRRARSGCAAAVGLGPCRCPCTRTARA